MPTPTRRRLVAARVAAVAEAVGRQRRTTIGPGSPRCSAMCRPARALGLARSAGRRIDQGLLSLLDRSTGTAASTARRPARVLYRRPVRRAAPPSRVRRQRRDVRLRRVLRCADAGPPSRLGSRRGPLPGARRTCGQRRRNARNPTHRWHRRLPRRRRPACHRPRRGQARLGGPFVLAETAGWFLGPMAAVRDLPVRPRRPTETRQTTLRLDDAVLVEQRVFFAEAVLNTMGMTDRFAPARRLCGHTSVTTNNPHATALECGACAGASGDGNARAVAALLNSPDVRHGSERRGITIPDDTWFVAGLHDTASDHVTSSTPTRRHTAPSDDSGTARRQAGPQARSREPARPGPRRMSGRRLGTGPAGVGTGPQRRVHHRATIDDGRARSRRSGLSARLRCRPRSGGPGPGDDHDGAARRRSLDLRAVLLLHRRSRGLRRRRQATAQPDRNTGVISGDRGDLRVGLPLQSTHVDGRTLPSASSGCSPSSRPTSPNRAHHRRNPILQTLTADPGSASRDDHTDQPWSTRTPDGTWMTMPDPSHTLHSDPNVTLPTTHHLTRSHMNTADSPPWHASKSSSMASRSRPSATSCSVRSNRLHGPTRRVGIRAHGARRPPAVQRPQQPVAADQRGPPDRVEALVAGVRRCSTTTTAWCSSVRPTSAGPSTSSSPTPPDMSKSRRTATMSVTIRRDFGRFRVVPGCWKAAGQSSSGLRREMSTRTPGPMVADVVTLLDVATLRRRRLRTVELFVQPRSSPELVASKLALPIGTWTLA